MRMEGTTVRTAVVGEGGRGDVMKQMMVEENNGKKDAEKKGRR